MKMNKILAAGAAAVVLAGFSGCSKKSGAPAAEEKVETVFAVNAYKTVPRTLDDYLEFGGNVQAASSVDIFPDVQSGKISTLYVQIGD